MTHLSLVDPGGSGGAGGPRGLDALDADRRRLLARLLAQRAGPAEREVIPRRPDGVEAVLSFAQERMWFLERLTPGTTAYSVAVPLRLRGAVDERVLIRALRTVVARHDSLRMRFPMSEDGRPVVEIGQTRDLPLVRVDVGDEPDPESAAVAAIRRELARPIDIGSQPPLRVVLVRLGDREYRCCVLVHHIVFDAESAEILVAEVRQAYDAVLAGDAVRMGGAGRLVELPVRYSDFAAWQRAEAAGERARSDLAYWRTQLAGVPRLELPTDRPHRDVGTVAGAYRFWLDRGLTAGIGEVARAHGATPYAVLLAAFQALLGWYSGQEDFAVGSPVGGRSAPGTEPLIGLFVNTVAQRADLAGDPSFADLLGRVRRTAVAAFAHQELPFEQVVSLLGSARDASRAPVFGVLMAYQHWVPSAAGSSDWITLDHTGLDNPSARHELSLHLTRYGDRIEGYATYRADLFDAETIERVFQRFVALVRQVTTAPATRLSELDLLLPGESATLAAWSDGGPIEEPAALGTWSDDGGPIEEPAALGTWSDGGDPTEEPAVAAPPGGAPVDAAPILLGDVLNRWVVATPDAPAVVHGRSQLTYRELDERANRLAHHLVALGVVPDDRVGICLEPGVDQAVAVLGILRAGAAYLPLDVEQPPARLAFLLADADARVIVTRSTLAGCAAPYQGTVVELDTDAAAIESRAGLPPVTAVGPDHLAYVNYTSGSTGAPKGVAVAHRPVLRYLAGARQRLGIVPASRFGLLQSLAFDFGVTSFYLPLSTGGSVHLIPRRASGAELAGYLERAGIDYLKLTPSHLASLAGEVEMARLMPRRALILGGEASRTEWTAEIARNTTAAVFNHYGPTEATVGVTIYRVPTGGGPGEAGPGGGGPGGGGPGGGGPGGGARGEGGPLGVPAGVGGPSSATTPLGRPMPGARVRVLNAARRPVPAGVPGEIYLGGERLARGYLGRPDLTAERFVTDPDTGERLYRTGDLGRWLPTGDLEFLGRADDQIKLRGYRIEPGEIEVALRERLGVPGAFVTVRDDRLVAYLERGGRQGADANISEIRRALAQTLPEYLIPARVVWLDRLPRMAHGKIDRRALPEPAVERPDQKASFVAPSGPVEEAIAATWAAVLGLDRVGAEDNFFDLGGHSLLAVQVVARVRRALPPGTRPVTVLELFGHPTVRAMARLACATADTPVRLLHELTRPIEPALRALTLVCVPYGGASAVVYQPLADAMPAGYSLMAVAIPGRDVGDEVVADARPLEEVAADCVAEIRDRIDGPLAIYGHCGVGGALAVEIARQLEAAGRSLAAVYLGGIFPFSRPVGRLGRINQLLRLERLRSDTVYATWLAALGADLGALDRAQQRSLIRAMRRDGELAEEYFTQLMHADVAPLSAPVISVVGERDPGTDFYQERYREWGFVATTTAAVVIAEAGHYFLRYRAGELAEIVTRTHPAIEAGAADRQPVATAPSPSWWLHGVSAEPERAGAITGSGAAAGERPSMGRFLVVAATQLVSATGTALTEYALPVWSYLGSGSLVKFALFAVVALLPGMLVAPVAGAVIDRSDRRRILIASSVAAGALVAALSALLWRGEPPGVAGYLLLAGVSVALAFQRLSYQSAVPQLVPKQYLGNANGAVQLVSGTATLLVPLLAVGLLSTIDLRGILLLDLVSYAVAVAVLLAVRFPRTMAGWRRESMIAEIRNGFGYFWRRRGLRAMLLFFVATNMFLAAVIVLVSPLVLTIGGLHDTGTVATLAGAGSVAAGLLMTLWGGPRERRMRGMLWATVAFGASAVVVGLRPELALVAVGAVGMSFAMVLQNGIWFTIVHTKVPQRFHGRVIALNFTVAQTVCALGFALAPLASGVLERLMRPGGALAGSAGALLGVGEGRGIGLLYVGCGAAIVLIALGAMRYTVLARFDETVPDSEPDDVVGLAALAQRHGLDRAEGGSTGGQGPDRAVSGRPGPRIGR